LSAKLRYTLNELTNSDISYAGTLHLMTLTILHINRLFYASTYNVQ